MNIVGIKTIVRKELMRSLRVPTQVFGAPIVTALLFFLVFGYSVGSRIGSIQGLSYSEFIMPGLIMMNVLTSTFMSVSSAFMLAKIMNVLSDIFIAPLSAMDILLGFSVAAVLRGVLTALLIWGVSLFFVAAHVSHPIYLLAFLFVVSLVFAILGLIAGIWATNFEQVSIFPTFLITPLSFLGGVFYSIETLPAAFQAVSRLNPFLYMINGLRYGFYGVSDVNALLSFGVSFVILAIVGFLAWYMLKIGYRVKS